MSKSNKKNVFNVNKLLHSKWTATKVRHKQKHFIVIELVRDELDQEIVSCVLQAVIDRQLYPIDWRVLKNSEEWIQGWQ